MATVKFNRVVTDAARVLKSARVLATDDVEPYSSALLQGYANRAIRDFIRDKFIETGEMFGELLPEYVKKSGGITLAGGLAVMPNDVMYALDLWSSSNKYAKISKEDVADIESGNNKLLVPSATRAYWWVEDGMIRTLGKLSDTVFLRYYATHVDISAVTTVGTAGNWNSDNGNWTALSRLLTVSMNSNFVAGDVGKVVAFRSAVGTFGGRIVRRDANNIVCVAGDGLPTVDITGGVLQVIVLDIEPDGADMKLSAVWHGEIVKRVVDMALRDTKEVSVVS